MTEIVPGVFLVDDRKCPKCGSHLFRKPCPCPFKRKGWKICARCVNPACATVVGIERAKGSGPARGEKRRNRKTPKGSLGPFGVKI